MALLRWSALRRVLFAAHESWATVPLPSSGSGVGFQASGSQISHPLHDPQGSASPDSARDCGRCYWAVKHEPLQLPPSNFPLEAEPSCQPSTPSSPPGPPLLQLFPPCVPRSCHGVCTSEDRVGQQNPQTFLRAASACDVETPRGQYCSTHQSESSWGANTGFMGATLCAHTDAHRLVFPEGRHE